MTRRSSARLMHHASAIAIACAATAFPAAADVNPTVPAQAMAPANAFAIQFRADTLVLSPVLSVAIVDRAQTVVAGETVRFLGYNNYPSFIERSEIRLFRGGQSPDSPPIAIIPVDADGAADWQVPDNGEHALFYTYRVTARDGTFDETRAKELTVVGRTVGAGMTFGPQPHPAFGVEDEAARRTIALHGLMVTVTGRADPARDRITVARQNVPVDADGRFVAQQIVARDEAGLEVVVRRDGQEVHRARQQFAVPADDWFVVAQGDLTLGRMAARGPARAVSGDTLADGDYAIGRAAF